MDKLKKCPFCGSEAEIKVHNPEHIGYGFTGAVAQCTVCGAKSGTASITAPAFTDKDSFSTFITSETINNGVDNATKLWNRRTDDN